jgi:hypothetical protein
MDSRFASLESKIDSRFANLEAETRRRLDKGPTATVSIVGHASLCPTYTLDTGVGTCGKEGQSVP